MKFGTLLELNSNFEWFDKYVDYDKLKTLFPDKPFEEDPRDRTSATDPESSPLLGDGNGRPSQHVGASEAEFTEKLEEQRIKVEEFYTEKETELAGQLDELKREVKSMEDRELEDVIEEEEEELEEERDDGESEDEGLPSSGITSSPVAPRTRAVSQDRFATVPNPTFPRKAPGRQGLLGRMKSTLTFANRNTADHGIVEADAQLAQRRSSRSRSQVRSVGRYSDTSPNRTTGRAAFGKMPSENGDADYFAGHTPGKRSSDGGHRLSMSSVSSEGQHTMAKGYRGNLHLVPLDHSSALGMSDSMTSDANGAGGGMTGHLGYVWSANTDYGKVLRIRFKKRITTCWLEMNSLRQFAELNMTAFEKILKKYDKNTNSKLKKRYIENDVKPSHPWTEEAKSHLEELTDQSLFLYARVAAGGDIELARQQLRAQLREKIVIDRETVWSKMIAERRGENAGLKVVPADEHLSASEKHTLAVKTPIGTLRIPSWISKKPLIFVIALGVLVGIIQAQPFERVEESNCLAMLCFCTILWATEAIPLFATSFCVPFLVVTLRLIRSTDGNDTQLSAADATKYIFSQIFSPTIMLLIGGFTIAAVLSKTRLDVMTASRVLNAAGSKPSVVLLVLMFVATFASMWISNVAAPTLCFALIKPITDDLAPKSNFARCLIIAIALAANIGGQASPISSPQNLIALGSMDPPLSWLQWFAISIPVSSLSVVAIWAFLHLGYRWEADLQIPRMRKNSDPLTMEHYYVLFVTLLTIGLWCGEKSMEAWVGDMGIIAIVPIVAFFGTGILSKDDFHHFQWSIVFLAMGGIALGKAVLSSGLLDDLDAVLEGIVEGKGLYLVLIMFSSIALVISTFISHTIAAVLLVPIAQRIGDGMEEPHPRLLIMVTALICSAGMGLPVSGFPNMTAIGQLNKLGQRYLEPSDFLKNGIPASIIATAIIVSLGYAIMRALGL